MPQNMAMEATQSAVDASSFGTQQNESSPCNSNPLPGIEEKGTHLRFLLSNAESGSIIGKGGSTINQIQSQSGAHIHLSRNYEYFPGTYDRIIMVSGAVDDVLKAIDLILNRFLDEFYAEVGAEIVPESRIRLVVPNSSCGGLIGKGGAIKRSMIEDSGADIKISAQDTRYPGLQDRLVTVTGILAEQLRAIELILLRLLNNPYYHQCAKIPFPYAAVYNGMNYGPNGAQGKYQGNIHPNQEDSSSVTIGVADEHIGLVVGRGGRNLMEMRQLTGTEIKISDRGDFMPGTSNRKVTITGSESAIRAAESMILAKVASA